ncbi:MAG: thiosulfate oxidation carrier complex protein SoxZ [Methyloligellaceae bacterium]
MAKPRVKAPKKVKAGEIFQVKTLISHKMETGLRKDKKTGELVPRQIIESFVAKFNGDQVFAVKSHAAISANPYFAFYMKAMKSGDLELTWKEDTGKTWSTKKSIAVE